MVEITRKNLNLNLNLIEAKESKDKTITGLIVPFNKVSRNGVLYNKESVIEKANDLVLKPLMWNHQTKGEELPKGEWTSVEVKEDGLYGTAKIFNTEYNKDLLEYLRNASEIRVSLNISGDAVNKQDVDGKHYREATVKEFFETSIVTIPGFGEAKVVFSESFEGSAVEQLNTEESKKKEEFMEKMNEIINNIKYI